MRREHRTVFNTQSSRKVKWLSPTHIRDRTCPVFTIVGLDDTESSFFEVGTFGQIGFDGNSHLVLTKSAKRYVNIPVKSKFDYLWNMHHVAIYRYYAPVGDIGCYGQRIVDELNTNGYGNERDLEKSPNIHILGASFVSGHWVNHIHINPSGAVDSTHERVHKEQYGLLSKNMSAVFFKHRETFKKGI